MSEETKFPFPDREEFGDVRTVAERAGIELRGEEGIPFHCGERMQVKEGVMGPDYARCSPCGLTMLNAASPHVNGGVVWNEQVMEEFGNVLWTTGPEHRGETAQASRETDSGP